MNCSAIITESLMISAIIGLVSSSSLSPVCNHFHIQRVFLQKTNPQRLLQLLISDLCMDFSALPMYPRLLRQQGLCSVTGAGHEKDESAGEN